jgi:hypothetical protein
MIKSNYLTFSLADLKSLTQYLFFIFLVNFIAEFGKTQDISLVDWMGILNIVIQAAVAIFSAKFLRNSNGKYFSKDGQ